MNLNTTRQLDLFALYAIYLSYHYKTARSYRSICHISILPLQDSSILSLYMPYVYLTTTRQLDLIALYAIYLSYHYKTARSYTSIFHISILPLQDSSILSLYMPYIYLTTTRQLDLILLYSIYINLTTTRQLDLILLYSIYLSYHYKTARSYRSICHISILPLQDSSILSFYIPYINLTITRELDLILLYSIYQSYHNKRAGFDPSIFHI